MVNQLVNHHYIIAIATLSILAVDSPAQGLKNVIPKNQKPIHKVLPPSLAEQSKAGTGKFVIFTREPVGKDWDFIAGAWECIPSRPEIPISKRVEFCHSSWDCQPLLDVLVSDDSAGMHPRFVTLQVDNGDWGYVQNLYDINYRNWEVRCIWQGSRLRAFGIIGDSIFCSSSDGWLLLNATSAKFSKDVPFTPIETDGGFWLVRKTGEATGCWSYDPIKREYVAHFPPVYKPELGLSWGQLSPDGRSRAWLLAPVPSDWRGGVLTGTLILQRNGEKEDVAVPIEFQAAAGSGVPVIPRGVQLTFVSNGNFQLRASKVRKDTEDRVWSIDIATGKVNSAVTPHSPPPEDEHASLGGVPVPDYLRREIKELRHFGRGGLAAAFLLHLGILKRAPEYADCTVGVSRNGRHVLFRAKKGPLAGVFIYGDLVTKQTLRWKTPHGFSADTEEFVWVETP
jgi:hypothetical protein